ncbi:hypothetical protein OP853_001259 [Salmonella enterica]|nr:hypothetical protein [Salmonella enterica]EKC7218824.1 hypothetical protein [Salmonella enterica]
MKITINPDSIELINQLRQWYENAVEGCNLMREHADKKFRIPGVDEFTLSEEEQKGFRIGVSLACAQFAFPLREVDLQVSESADTDDEEDN